MTINNNEVSGQAYRERGNIPSIRIFFDTEAMNEFVSTSMSITSLGRAELSAAVKFRKSSRYRRGCKMSRSRIVAKSFGSLKNNE